MYAQSNKRRGPHEQKDKDAKDGSVSGAGGAPISIATVPESRSTMPEARTTQEDLALPANDGPQVCLMTFKP